MIKKGLLQELKDLIEEAKTASPARVAELENRLLEIDVRDKKYYILDFACYANGANIERLQEAYIEELKKTNDHHMISILMFGKLVKGVNVSKLLDAAIELCRGRELVAFAIQMSRVKKLFDKSIITRIEDLIIERGVADEMFRLAVYVVDVDKTKMEDAILATGNVEYIKSFRTIRGADVAKIDLWLERNVDLKGPNPSNEHSELAEDSAEKQARKLQTKQASDDISPEQITENQTLTIVQAKLQKKLLDSYKKKCNIEDIVKFVKTTPGADLEKIEDVIIAQADKTHYLYPIYYFAEEIHWANIEKLENALINIDITKKKGILDAVKWLGYKIDKILIGQDYELNALNEKKRLMCEFAIYVKGADLTKIVDKFMELEDIENVLKVFPQFFYEERQDVAQWVIDRENKLLAEGSSQAITDYADYIASNSNWKEIASLEACEDEIIKRGNPSDMYWFVRRIDETNVSKFIDKFVEMENFENMVHLLSDERLNDEERERMNKWLLDRQDKVINLDYSLIFGKFNLLYNYAKSVKGADISKLEDEVIKTYESWYFYQFARDIEGANIAKLEKAVIKSCNPFSIYRFADEVKGANFRDLESAIYRTRDLEYIEKIQALEKVKKQEKEERARRRAELVKKGRKILTVSPEEFAEIVDPDRYA